MQTSIGIKASIGFAASWCLLGFRRGLNVYDYTYNKHNSFSDKKEPYMYSTKFANGPLGVLIYVNPVLLAINYS